MATMTARPTRLVVDHPAIALGLVALALHLWANGSYGYFRDELYFIVCGRHPAWGYTDQPPLTPWIAALSQAAFGSLRGVRLVPALSSGALVALTAAAAGLLAGGLYARWLAGLAVLVGGFLQAVGSLLTTDSLQPLAWLVVGICVIKAERDEEPRWWFVAGAVGGVAFLAKYTVALFLASLALALLLTPERRLLDRWQPWAAAALAAAIAAPNLIWQAANGWPFVAHTAVLAAEKNIPLSPPAFLAQEVLVLSPATAPVWIAGLAAFAFWPRFAAYRWVAVAWALLIVASLLGRARPYYIAPAYPLLIAGGAVALEAWLPRLAKPVLACAVLAVGAIGIPLFMPILPVETFIAYQRALGFRPSTGEKLKLGELPQYYADQFGWPEIAKALGEAYQALPPEDRAHAVVFAWNYGDAAAADVLGASWSLPPAISGHESYWLWGPRSADGSVVLVYGGPREWYLPVCGSVEPVGYVDNPYGMPEESGQTVWLCRDVREPFEKAWPKLRHFG
jgi:4-amino-4-deoxy-L-arabinose transferase-like glycosyltransferase